MSRERAEFESIVGMVRGLDDLQQRAAREYRPVVDDILRTRSPAVRHIERKLDGLLDTLRERFQLPERRSAAVSRVIATTIELGMIRPDEEAGASKKHARYLPFWA